MPILFAITGSALGCFAEGAMHTAVASGSWCGAERQQRGDSGSVLI